MPLDIDNITQKIKSSKSFSSIIKSINKKEEMREYVIEITNFLNEDISIKQRLYHIKYDMNNIIICGVCDNNERVWDNKLSHYRNWCDNKDCKKKYMISNRDILSEKVRVLKIKETKKKRYGDESYNNREKSKQTCKNRYGVDSFSKTNSFKEKMVDAIGVNSPFSLEKNRIKSKQTLYDRYNVTHNSKIPEVIQKRTNTFMKIYGTKTPSENSKIRDKIISTNIKKYNGNSPMCDDDIKTKSKETLMKNYGVSSPLDSEVIRDKYKKTMLDRYGYEYWLQDGDNHEWMIKKSYKYKKISINNKEYYLQGYEDYVLYEILMKQYNTEDIMISNKEISNETGNIYYYKNDNSRHRYYPDFYIKNENKIVEVKGDYTYNRDLEINLLKKDSCKKMGMVFEFLIIDEKIYEKWGRER